MPLLTEVVVRRYMKETSGFTFCDGGNIAALDLPVADEEAVLGWYRNPGALGRFTSCIYVGCDLDCRKGGTKERISSTRRDR